MSDDDAQYEVNTGDAGSADTVSVEAGQIRKGGYIMIKGKPCKVRDVSVSKTGKHGHAKCKFSAVDIFTGNTCEELCPATHNIDVPVVTKKDWTITGMDDGFVCLMDDDGEMREDLKPPDQLYKTEEDIKTSQLIAEYLEEMDAGANT